MDHVHLGFSYVAEKLVIETIRGSVDYYESQSVHVADLRNKVTAGWYFCCRIVLSEKDLVRTAIHVLFRLHIHVHRN